MKQQSLYEKLEEYAKTGRIPFHMPGHKRSDRYPYLNSLGAALDLTEIDGFDNLHDPQGILREGMEMLSSVYGSGRSFYLINGSTGGLLAAVRCAVPWGSEVVMARNCHKAVYNAVELVGARPVYLHPDTDKTFGFCLDVAPCEVEAVLDEHPTASAVIVTSPTYDGVVSDIASIASICHSRGIPLIVDEAHGAHLGFLDDAVGGAVAKGADIVIQSFHKTLPSLTQTGVAHISGEIIDPDRFAEELSVFETSSPSYLLMASLDGCTRLLASEEKRESFFRRWREIIGYAEQRLSEIPGVQMFMRNARCHRELPGYDRSKLAVCAEGLDGPTLAAHLRRYGIEPEMVSAAYVLLMTGADTSHYDIDVLAQALSQAKGTTEFRRETVSCPRLERMMTPYEVRRCEKEIVPLEKLCEGAVSGDYVFAYPPGIPIVVPGEVITAEVKEALKQLLTLGLNPSTLHGAFNGDISVVKRSFVLKTY